MAGKIHNRVTARQMTINPGDPVTVTRDDGSKLITRATSMPWLMGSTWVVSVERISGSFALCRVQPLVGGGT